MFWVEDLELGDCLDRRGELSSVAHQRGVPLVLVEHQLARHVFYHHQEEEEEEEEEGVCENTLGP